MVGTLVWKIVAIAFAKKATIYVLGRTYGYSRLYRRFIEFNRRKISNRSVQRSLQNKVKYIFRIPNRIAYSLGWTSQRGQISNK